MGEQAYILAADETDLQRDLRRLQTSSGLDSFYRAWCSLVAKALPHHSTKIEFHNLEVFKPSLVRDSKTINHDPRYLLARFQADVTQDFLLSHPGLELCLSRDIFREGDPKRVAEWRKHFMLKEGWDKFMKLNFWKAGKRIAGLTVRRTATQPDFSPTEQLFFRHLHEMLREGVDRLYTLHCERQTRACLQNLLRSLPLPVLILDWNLQTVFVNLEGRKACAEWVLGFAKARTITPHLFEEIPKDILQVCQRLKGSESSPLSLSVHRTHEGLEASIEIIETREDIV
ncbi:MAG: hypothetical protein L0312_13225, partial [Acidobacteria bacterium]|nr:hypothetical protein [Acidobacteriota bacterium]